MPGLAEWLDSETRSLIAELHEHGVDVDFGYAYEAVLAETVEDAWCQPTAAATAAAAHGPAELP